MAQREVTIKISAQDNFSDVTRKYQRAMADNATATEQSAKRSTSFLSGMRTELQGLVAGVTIGAAYNTIGQLNEIGMTARQQGAIFKQMMGEMGVSAEDMLGRLRAATRGVVDDLSLMEGGSFLRRMGLVDDEDQLEELLGNIIALKSPTEDATTAIQNFGLMISNQSLLRLDSFGLSSARVKERMEELQATLGREEAFKLAVFEEMNKQVERLGPAVDAATSSFDRMGTRIQNTIGQIGEVVASGLEAGAQLVEMATMVVEHQIAENERMLDEARERQRRQQSLVEIAIGRVEDQLDTLALDPYVQQGLLAGEAFGEAFTSEVMDRIERFPDVRTPQDLLMRTSFSYLLDNPETRDLAIRAVETLVSSQAEVTSELERQVRLAEQLALLDERAAQYASANAIMRAEDAERRRELIEATGRAMPLLQWVRGNERIAEREAELAARAEAEARAQREAEAESARELNRAYQMMMRERAAERRAEMQPELEAAGRYYGIAMQRYGELNMLRTNAFGMRGAIGDQTFFSDADVQRAREIAFSLEDFADVISDRQEIYSAEEIERAREMAREAANWRDYIIKGKEALDNLTLAQMFGQTGGGRAGEIGDAVVAGMEAAGMTDEQIKAFTSLMDLASGRETELSRNFDEEVVPGIVSIFEQFGEQAAVEAALAYERGMTRFTGAGIRPTNPFGLTGYMNIGGDGASLGGYTVRPNEGHSHVAAGLGIPLSEVYARGILRPDQMLHPGETFGGSAARVTPMPGVTGPLGPAAFDMAGMPPAGGAVPPTPLASALSDIEALRDRWAEVAGNADSYSSALDTSVAPMETSVSGASKLASHAKEAADHAGKLRDYIAEMAGKVHLVKMEFDAEPKFVPQWMDEWLRAGIAKVMNDEGGSYSGAEPITQGRVARVE